MEPVTIRMSRPDDYEKAISLVLQFSDEIMAEYGLDLTVSNFKQEMSELVNSSFVAEKNGELVGLIAGKFVQFPFSTDKIYQEQIWFVRKEYRSLGMRLMDTLVKWCKEQGTKFIVTSRMANFKADKFDAVYKRIGFVPYEINYIKTI